MKKVFTLLSIIFVVLSAHAQLTTDTITDIQQSVLNNLVSNGINVNNIVYTGHANSIGEFDCNGCGLGINNGIVLTTGFISSIGGNSSTGTSGYTLSPVDPDLQSASNGGVMESTTLEFDYQIATDSIEITFVFGSEEYNEFVNYQYNDIFAFFISGQGINNENIALIPGSTLPISINNINNGNSNSVSSGPCTNCQYFVDNAGSGSQYPIEFDGFTTVITSKRAATPGSVYHMKLSIGDVGDGGFDSGVFIAGNSIGAKGTAPIYIDGNRIAQTTTINKCSNEIITITAPPGGTYLWSTGETTQAIDAIQDGVYKLDLSFGGNATAISDSVIIVNSFSLPQQPVISYNSGLLTSSSASGNQWFLDGQIIPGAMGQTLNPTSSGSYTVQVTDSSTGCISEISDPFLITSLDEFSTTPFNLYINHDNASITLNVKADVKGILRIFNVLGAEIVKSEISSGETNIHLPAKGTYLINLISDKEIYSEKFILN